MEPEIVNTGMELGKNILLGITSAISLASLITAGTRTPSRFTKFGKIYRLIEKIALVVGKAKQQD